MTPRSRKCGTGITPDAEKAAEWYEKAKQAGVTEADAALTTLSAAAQP
jgi:TPR repeat protein